MKKTPLFFFLIFICCCKNSMTDNTFISTVSDDWSEGHYRHTYVNRTLSGDTLSSFILFGNECRILSGDLVSVVTWDKTTSTFKLSFYADDGKKKDSLYSSLDNLEPIATSNPRYVAMLLTDYELHLDTDSAQFLLYDLIEKKASPFLVVNNRIEGVIPQKVFFAYYDYEPRGAGQKTLTQKLRVVDLWRGKVSDCYKKGPINDTAFETGEELINQFSHIQWLNNRELAYSTIQFCDSNSYIFRVYSYNIKKQKTKKEYEISTDISIDGIDFMVHNKTLFVKNRIGIYKVQANKLMQLFQADEYEDFFVGSKRI